MRNGSRPRRLSMHLIRASCVAIHCQPIAPILAAMRRPHHQFQPRVLDMPAPRIAATSCAPTPRAAENPPSAPRRPSAHRCTIRTRSPLSAHRAHRQAPPVPRRLIAIDRTSSSSASRAAHSAEPAPRPSRAIGQPQATPQYGFAASPPRLANPPTRARSPHPTSPSRSPGLRHPQQRSNLFPLQESLHHRLSACACRKSNKSFSAQ